jgi:carboxyl-terminal processing protease
MLQWKRQEPPYLSEALKQEFAKGNRIVRKLLPGGIGYLRVPGMVMDPSEYDQASQRLLDSLYALEAEGARKFIIDLRLNAGGTMFPMIAGLSPLLGDGRSSAKRGMHAGSPVVILTGHGTSSAGERVAVAFKGRKHTWFIGEPTAGDMTGNVRHWIVNGQVSIVIAETMLADRKHRCYPRNLIPDEWIPGGDDFINYDEDRKIQAAMKRLK